MCTTDVISASGHHEVFAGSIQTDNNLLSNGEPVSNVSARKSARTSTTRCIARGWM